MPHSLTSIIIIIAVNSTKWNAFVKIRSSGWRDLIETVVTRSRIDKFKVYIIRSDCFASCGREVNYCIFFQI